MEKYEEETRRFAIWRGRITEGFRKWQKGEKIYEKDKERIMLLVSEETKSRWQQFKKDKYPTISKLIREAVNFFIDFKEDQASPKTISQISRDLKDSLTVIKGYSQMLFENYKDKLNWDVLSKIKKIYDQSQILENKILNDLEESKVNDSNYDILIIEDDYSAINLLTDFFNIKGHSSKYVMTGKEALEDIKIHAPKLILLDILLPDISGYQVCHKIKSIEKLKNIPIFYITAIPRSEVVDKLEETGANGYFLKPFDFTSFEILLDYL